jgi:hypothetical protein
MTLIPLLFRAAEGLIDKVRHPLVFDPVKEAVGVLTTLEMYPTSFITAARLANEIRLMKWLKEDQERLAPVIAYCEAVLDRTIGPDLAAASCRDRAVLPLDATLKRPSDRQLKAFCKRFPLPPPSP